MFFVFTGFMGCKLNRTIIGGQDAPSKDARIEQEAVRRPRGRRRREAQKHVMLLQTARTVLRNHNVSCGPTNFNYICMFRQCTEEDSGGDYLGVILTLYKDLHYIYLYIFPAC